MKLIFCRKCGDMVAMHKGLRSCQCGRSSGVYRGSQIVEVSGPCAVVGISDSSLWIDIGQAEVFPRDQGHVDAWVIREPSQYIERLHPRPNQDTRPRQCWDGHPVD